MGKSDIPKDLSELVDGQAATVISAIGPGRIGTVQVATAIGFIEISAVSDDELQPGEQVVIVELTDGTVVDPVSRVQQVIRQVTVSRNDPEEGF